MIVSITKEFRFEAAHTLARKIDAEASRRIHGHSYRAEITLRGRLNTETGMLIDMGSVEHALAPVRDALDHHLLDEVPELGPATMENLAVWIWAKLAAPLPSLTCVAIYRDSIGERCEYHGPERF